MQRKQFEQIAAVLKSVKPADDPSFSSGSKAEQWEDTVEAFLAFLPTTNSNFKASTFKAACGMDD